MTTGSIFIKVNLERIPHYEKRYYPESDTCVIDWLEENLGKRLQSIPCPCRGEHWKCWAVYDPAKNFEISFMEIEFDCQVDDSIISLFVLQWT